MYETNDLLYASPCIILSKPQSSPNESETDKTQFNWQNKTCLQKKYLAGDFKY